MKEAAWADLGGREAHALVEELAGRDLYGEQAKEPLPLAEWVVRHRRIIGGPSPGPWRHRNAPAAREPMEALDVRGVTSVVVMTPTQLFKSELAVNVVVWGAALGHDVLFWEPELDLARRFAAQRIRPALMAVQDQIRITGLDDAYRKKRDSIVEIHLPGGGSILVLSRGQKSGKAAHTGRIGVVDEVEQMKDPGMPLAVAARLTAYGSDAKQVYTSTPGRDTAGSSYRLWSEGSRGEWHGLCPVCAKHSRMRWGQVKFGKDPDGWWQPEGARLHCSVCEAPWTNAQRRAAIGAGCYIHQDPDHSSRTFWVPGPAHVWRSVEDIVSKGRGAWRGAIEENDWKTYEEFINWYAGEVWDPDVQGMSASKIEHTGYSLGARGRGDQGQLPEGARFITVAADAGTNALYAEWVAWGVETEPLRLLCWGLKFHVFGGKETDDIEDGAILSAFGEALDQWVWRGTGGKKFGYLRGMVDVNFRPEIVHPFLRQRYLDETRGRRGLLKPFGARLLPLIGRSTIANRHHPLDLRSAVQSKDKRRRLPAVVYADVNAIKDVVYDTLHADQRLPEDDRAWRWPQDPASCGYGLEYRKQLTSEVKVRTRTPRGEIKTAYELKRPGMRDNEALDVRVYNYAAALQVVFPRGIAEGMLELPVIGGDRRAGGEAATVISLPRRKR